MDAFKKGLEEGEKKRNIKINDKKEEVEVRRS